MAKNLYILLIVSILTSSVFGQFIGRDNLSVSLFYLQKNEVDSAKKYVDLSISDEDLKSKAKTWYYRGFIYKELYKEKEKENKTSPLRLIAIESFKMMLSLKEKDEFTESTSKIIKYLASTLYNDAARMLDTTNYSSAITNYELFKDAMLLIDSNVDLKSRDVKFKLALASMLNKPAESEEGLDSTQTNLLKDLYHEVLELDSNNPSANYNLALLYYNEAADIINNMAYDMDLVKLNEVQDYCIEIFLEGLPYMKKAHELNFKRKETLEGLSNIYYGLNDMEKSNQYKKELQNLTEKSNDLEKE